MDECCNVCGSVGFPEAMATCCKCLTSREHLYCMRVFQLEQPDQWFCQDCEPDREAAPSSCATREDLVPRSSFKKPNKVNKDTRQFACPDNSSKELKKVHGNSYKWERRVKTGRTQYIPVAEALRLPSGSKKSEKAFTSTYRPSPVLPQTTGQFASPVTKNSSRQLVNEHKHATDAMAQTRVEMTQKKAFVTPSPSIGSGTKVQSEENRARSLKEKPPIDSLVDVAYPKSAEAKVERATKRTARISNMPTYHLTRVQLAPRKALSPPSVSSIRASKIISDSRIPEPKGKLVIKKASPGLNTSTIGAPSMCFGGDVRANVHLKSSEEEKDNQENVQPNEEQYRGPSQDVSWKGCFKMLSDEFNKGICSGIQGCPPSIVMKKVYEMLKRMPETLQFELIPRADVWENIFQDQPPDFDDVGIFFFPSDHKRCDDYFTWLEHIGKADKVMRMYMRGVELLVFTSAYMHKNCQTWHGAYFFWGIFSSEKVRRSTSDNKDVLRLCPANEILYCCSNGDDSLVADMVIDMEAGVDVGMGDVVVKRKPPEDCCGTAGEPLITTTTNVASARLALSVEKGEPVDKSSRVNASHKADARDIASSSKEVHTDIPPGFEELKTLRATIASKDPRGLEKVHALTSSPETSADNLLPKITDYPARMASKKQGDPSNPSHVNAKSEIR